MSDMERAGKRKSQSDRLTRKTPVRSVANGGSSARPRDLLEAKTFVDLVGSVGKAQSAIRALQEGGTRSAQSSTQRSAPNSV
jgi:hypothetical protein